MPAAALALATSCAPSGPVTIRVRPMPVIVPAKNRQFFRIALLPERCWVAGRSPGPHAAPAGLTYELTPHFRFLQGRYCAAKRGSRTRAALSAEMDLEGPKSRSRPRLR